MEKISKKETALGIVVFIICSMLCVALAVFVPWMIGEAILTFAVDNNFEGNIPLYAEGQYTIENSCSIKVELEENCGNKDISNIEWYYMKPSIGNEATKYYKAEDIFVQDCCYKIYEKNVMPNTWWARKVYFIETIKCK